MFRYFLLGIAAICLSGCMETTATSFNGPSGAQVSSAKCQYASAGCLQQAAQTCRGPYQVLDSDSHSGGLLADLMPGPVTWYSMTYQCGASDGKMPAFAFRGQQWSDSPTIVTSGGTPASDAPRLGNSIPQTVRCQTMGTQTVCR
jgi:hypothetical protein